MEDAFEERKRKQEEKWAHDEALRFKVMARRNKLAGLWAAAELGYRGERADTYAKSVVSVGLQTSGVDNVFQKLRADFDAAKVTHSDHVIRQRLEELQEEAAEQVWQDKP